MTEFEEMTFYALVRSLQGRATEEDVRILCWHAGMDFKHVKEKAYGKDRRNDRVQVLEAVGR